MLENYSGELLPNISLEEFSKDVLVDLLMLYSKLYVAIDGFWYLSIKERMSDEEALACDIWVWEKQIKYELNRLTKLLKIQGNDVIALMKALQFAPWFRAFKYKMEIEDKNHGVLTIVDCPTLAALEKEGEGREEKICKIMDSFVFQKYAEYFSPNMQVQPLKLPPRKSQDEISCQWDFSLK